MDDATATVGWKDLSTVQLPIGRQDSVEGFQDKMVSLSDPGVPWVRSLGPDHRMSVHPSATFWHLTDVTLADEDTNSIPTDNANRAIQDNVALQWYKLVANFRTNASGATQWPNFEPMQIMVAQFATNATLE